MSTIERVSWPDKYTGENFIRGIDWTSRLGAATIATRNFTVRKGSVTVSGITSVGAISKANFSAGTAGLVEILCEVVASDGTILQEVAEFNILSSS